MTTILFRDSYDVKEEIAAARKFFPRVVTNRTNCKDDIVIGRYSCLPFYKELEEDLDYNNCGLVNNYRQHRWIANFEYYNELEKYTPRTWSEDVFFKADCEGPFVVKGRTNSKKYKWNTHMFARNKHDAYLIASELRHDFVLGDQGIIVREYIPLKTFEIGLNNQPFVNEWRVFYYKDKRLTYGYYWSMLDDLSKPYITDEALEMADEVAKICSRFVNFYALDIAECEDGKWILIEVNDGQMSGLSEIPAELFYYRLSKALKV